MIACQGFLAVIPMLESFVLLEHGSNNFRRGAVQIIIASSLFGILLFVKRAFKIAYRARRFWMWCAKLYSSGTVTMYDDSRSIYDCWNLHSRSKAKMVGDKQYNWRRNFSRNFTRHDDRSWIIFGSLSIF